jgi:hypothetical protein
MNARSLTEPALRFRTTMIAILLVFTNTLIRGMAFGDVIPEEAPPVYADEWAPGFQFEDSTEALQGAIDSGARHIIVRNMGSDWIVQPIHLRFSNQRITFEAGVRVVARKGYFHGVNDALFSTAGDDGVEPLGVHHILIEGEDAVFRMHKQDYAGPGYEEGQWRHTIRLTGAHNIRISGLTLQNSGGDGVYIGHFPCSDIHLKNITAEDHYRQGISITDAENVLVENCIFRNTSGTFPEAGVDLEPNHAGAKIKNIAFVDTSFSNNEGFGALIWLPYLTPDSEPIEVLFQDCLIEGTGMVIGETNVAGRILIDRVTIQNTDLGAIDLVDKSTKNLVEFSNLTLRETAKQNLEGLTPIMLYGQNPNIDHGNIRFHNVMVEDNGARAVMSAWEQAWSPGGLHDTEGAIFVEDADGAWADLNVTHNVVLNITQGTPPPPEPPVPVIITPSTLSARTIELTCTNLSPRALNRVQMADPFFKGFWHDYSFFITDSAEKSIQIQLDEDDTHAKIRILTK